MPRRPLFALAATGTALCVATATAGLAATSVGAAPSAKAPQPTGLTAAVTARGLALFWNGHGASTFQVQQSDDSGFSTGDVSYTLHNGYTQFTPPQVSAGSTYYFRVRAGSGSATSSYTAVVSGSPTTTLQPIRVMTYNITETTADGGHEGGGTIAPWSKRRPEVAALIRRQAPDVVAVEETAAWIGPVSHRVRQIDSLESELGAPYKIAPTEPVYPQRHWFRTGVNILYNSTNWALGQRNGHFSIGNKKWGAYQVLINRSTGARFLFIATHLIPGNSTSLEAIRQKETETLFTKGHKLSVASGYPVAYAGDFNAATNTDPNYTYDSTSKAAGQFRNDDAFFVAPKRINGAYDSANLYHRTPPKSADRIDRIFTGPGVATTQAGIEFNPSSGPVPSDHNPLWADLAFPYPAG